MDELHIIVNDIVTWCVKAGWNILGAIVIYVVGRYLIGIIKKLTRNLLDKRKVEASVETFLLSFVNITLTILLVIAIAARLGVETTSFAALLASAGVAIGMALSGTLQNFSGGLLILAFKPFKVGDFIEAQGYAGTVTEMSIVSTRLTLPDNRSVTIPHGTLANGNINNYSRNPIRRLEWKVALEYGVDAQACEAKLLEIAKADSRVLDSSFGHGALNPFAAVSQLNDSSVEFVLRAWVKNQDYWTVYFAINDAIYNQLPQSGFGFPFPQMDIHVKS